MGSFTVGRSQPCESVRVRDYLCEDEKGVVAAIICDYDGFGDGSKNSKWPFLFPHKSQLTVGAIPLSFPSLWRAALLLAFTFNLSSFNLSCSQKHIFKTHSPGEWRSLVAHLVWDQRVAGSNPVSPTI